MMPQTEIGTLPFVDVQPNRTATPVVKICGIMQPEHAVVAANHGADMIGLVFARSRRQVSVEVACRVRQAIASLRRRPLVVGVFVNEPLERILDIAHQVGLDALQLSGDEGPEYVAACARQIPVIKALRFTAGTSFEEAIRVLNSYQSACRDSDRLRFLLDAHQSGAYGGTGTLADWSLAAGLAARHEIMLAGGLSPDNVADAIAAVSPWGVDVSSGVESDGVKDPLLIRDFLVAARQSYRKDVLR
jgi:phosphoribosylanthranilate isomerase